MLLESIYYGKIPITTAYRNKEVIWSTAEEKEIKASNIKLQSGVTVTFVDLQDSMIQGRLVLQFGTIVGNMILSNVIKPKIYHNLIFNEQALNTTAISNGLFSQSSIISNSNSNGLVSGVVQLQTPYKISTFSVPTIQANISVLKLLNTQFNMAYNLQGYGIKSKINNFISNLHISIQADNTMINSKINSMKYQLCIPYNIFGKQAQAKINNYNSKFNIIDNFIGNSSYAMQNQIKLSPSLQITAIAQSKIIKEFNFNNNFNFYNLSLALQAQTHLNSTHSYLKLFNYSIGHSILSHQIYFDTQIITQKFAMCYMVQTYQNQINTVLYVHKKVAINQIYAIQHSLMSLLYMANIIFAQKAQSLLNTVRQQLYSRFDIMGQSNCICQIHNTKINIYNGIQSFAIASIINPSKVKYQLFNNNIVNVIKNISIPIIFQNFIVNNNISSTLKLIEPDISLVNNIIYTKNQLVLQTYSPILTSLYVQIKSTTNYSIINILPNIKLVSNIPLQFGHSSTLIMYGVDKMTFSNTITAFYNLQLLVKSSKQNSYTVIYSTESQATLSLWINPRYEPEGSTNLFIQQAYFEVTDNNLIFN